MITYHFKIADLVVRISFEESKENGLFLIPSLEPFRLENFEGEPFLDLFVKDELTPLPAERVKRIRAFDTGNGDTIVDLIDTQGYQYIIENIQKKQCCLLQTDKSFRKCVCALNGDGCMRTFGLNNALMLVYAFAAATENTLLIHASLVRKDERGYAFIAKSGTGKSTQVSMWLRYIPGCDLMNDDNPIVRIIDDEVWIYGSPWSGKTPCYRNIRARLGAITRIERDTKNWIEKLHPVQAFASFLPSCSSMKWDIDTYNAICNTITKVVEKSGLYTLHCLPDEEAAQVCYKAVSAK